PVTRGRRGRNIIEGARSDGVLERWGTPRRSITPLSSEHFPAVAQNHHGDNHQEKDADEGVSFEDGEPASRPRAQHIAQPHRHRELVKNSVRGGEINHRGKVPGKVDDLRAGRRRQEVEAKQADENENQKAARAWPEKTVVKTDHYAHQNAELPLAVGLELRRVQGAEVFPPGDGYGTGNEQHEHQRLEKLGFKQRDRARAEK